MRSPRREELDARQAAERAAATQYVSSALGASMQGDTEQDFHENLKSGVALCNFLNHLRPGTVTKFKCAPPWSYDRMTAFAFSTDYRETSSLFITLRFFSLILCC